VDISGDLATQPICACRDHMMDCGDGVTFGVFFFAMVVVGLEMNE
jgi:hypothetical protein